MKTKARMVAPDIVKIAAIIFVILIHHKKDYSPLTLIEHDYFFNNMSVVLLALGIVLFVVSLKKGTDKKRCFDLLLLPILAAIGLVFFRRFAVGIFLIMSGYLMSGTLDRLQNPFAEWYKARNLIPRILRFYLPLMPIFVIALLYKIFVLGNSYSMLEIVVRFFLGGFRPGGYYVAILIQLTILFPVIHAVVRRYNFCGVIICVAFTLLYDVLATISGMNEVLYKFLVFRLTSHIAFGVYMKYADYNKDKIRNLIIFVIGLIYAVFCVFTDTYHPKLFSRWDDVSLVTSFFLYPAIVWFINKFNYIQYNNSKLSECTLAFANATYHIFLVQLLWYTTIGFDLNEQINNAVITLGLNVILTVPLGILYFKFINPFENKIISKIKNFRRKPLKI